MIADSHALAPLCLDEAVHCGAAAAELLIKESRTREACLPSGRRGESREQGISLRLFMPDGRASFGALTAGGAAGRERVRDFVRRTASSAGHAFAAPLPDLPGGDAPEGRGLGLYDPDIDLPASALMETAREVQEAVSEAMGSSRVEMKMLGTVSTVALFNTSGFQGSYRQTMARLDMTLSGSRDGRSSATRVVRAARSLRGLAPDAAASEAASLLEERLAPRVPPSGIHPVILSPVAAADLVAALSAWLCRGRWGDDEDAAPGGSQPRRGERIGSRQVSIHDDGRLPGGLATAPFDGEGTPTRKTTVVDRGVVVEILRDLASGARGPGSTGNGLRGSFREPPRLSASNMFIAPGSAAPSELLSPVRQGIRISALGRIPPMEDPDTSFTIPFTGRWIQDGKLEAPLGGGHLAGTLREILGEVEAAGSDFTFTHRRGSFGAPSLLLRRAPVRSS